jgi:site-specific recombinase XerD
MWIENRPAQSRSFRRKIDADNWLKRESLKIEDNKVGRLKGSAFELSDFFDQIYFPNSGVSEGTAKDYLRMFDTHLRPKFGHRKIASVSSLEWAEHFRSLKESGLGKARINRIHAVASAIYSVGIKWSYVSMNPLTLVEWENEGLSAKPKSWSNQELSQFLNWSHKESIEFYPLYHFIYETGLRISEVISLKWDCIDLDKGLIEVRRKYSRIMKRIEPTTKSGHKRILSINSSLKESLMRAYNKQRSEFVFSKDDGEMLAYETIRMRFLRDQKASGVPVLGLHGLRHTFASHFVMNGGNIYDLMALLGHSDIKTTMGYAHLSSSHLASKASLVQFRPENREKLIQLNLANHIPTIDSENKKAPETEAI